MCGILTFPAGYLCRQVKESVSNKGLMVSAESGGFTSPTWRQPWWPCPFQGEQWGWLRWPFAVATLFRNWWIDCGAAASVSVPWAKASRLRVGIPAMASALGLLLWQTRGGPWGLVAPGAAPNPHTAVTPLETQRHSPLRTSGRPRQNDSLPSAAIPKGNYLILRIFSWWQQLEEAEWKGRLRFISPALSHHYISHNLTLIVVGNQYHEHLASWKWILYSESWAHVLNNPF